jgi:hypothetical protein
MHFFEIIAYIFDLSVFCLMPAICFFLRDTMRKKSKKEIYRFIDKIHLFLRLKLFHCESGFFFYIFFIIVYLCIYNIFSAQNSYLYVLVLYFVTVALYASFRNCFTII